jgi:hypothetical protein
MKNLPELKNAKKFSKKPKKQIEIDFFESENAKLQLRNINMTENELLKKLIGELTTENLNLKSALTDVKSSLLSLKQQEIYNKSS